MFYIDNCLISDDLINTKFCCNLADCKGACCIEGDEGAPLEANEVGSLEDYKKKYIPLYDRRRYRYDKKIWRI
jgi:hypothetical protein